MKIENRQDISRHMSPGENCPIVECFDYFLWDVVNEVGGEKSSRRITEGIEKFPFNEDETFTKMLILSRIRRIRPVVYELYIANIAKK